MSRSCCFHLLMCWSLNHLRKTAFSFSFPSLMLPYDLSSSSSQVNQTTPHYQPHPHPHQQHERCLQAPNHALLLRLLCPNTGTTSLPRQVEETRWFARLSSGMVCRVAQKFETPILTKTNFKTRKPVKHEPSYSTERCIRVLLPYFPFTMWVWHFVITNLVGQVPIITVFAGNLCSCHPRPTSTFPGSGWFL